MTISNQDASSWLSKRQAFALHGDEGDPDGRRHQCIGPPYVWRLTQLASWKSGGSAKRPLLHQRTTQAAFESLVACPRALAATALREDRGNGADQDSQIALQAPSCGVIEIERDAILHSIEANADHGVRRSIAVRRRAITMVLQDPKWTAWSNSEIAQRCAVSDKTASRTYRDRHGNMSQMQTDRIGRRAEPELNAPAESEAQGELLDEAPEASESGEPPPELALVIHLTDVIGR